MSPQHGLLLSLAAAAILAGCHSPPLTQSQMDALQVREVDAAHDRTFAAAAGALMDAGYQIQVTDSDAGLLTGEKKENPSVAADVAVVILTAVLSGGRAATDIPPSYHTVSIQVLPQGATRSSVRIRPFLNGRCCPCTDSDKDGKEKVQELWALMQRQVLMKEPAR